MKVQVWIGKSRIAGKGLFAGQAIKKDTIISRYMGTKISKAQSARALAHGNAYICYLNDRYDIDGNTLQNPPRYINHSCDPNCALQTTARAIWVVALRDIWAGEELTHQYNYEYDPERYTDFPCFCGAKNCVGYIVDARYWEVITQQHKYALTG
jgi:SET domain-containing protein